MNITIQLSCFQALDPAIATRYNSVSKSPIEGRFTLLIFSTASNVTVKITSKLSELSSSGELKAQDRYINCEAKLSSSVCGFPAYSQAEARVMDAIGNQ